MVYSPYLTMKKEVIVIALGGNALIEEGRKPSVLNQFKVAKKALRPLVPLFKKNRVIICHGSGYQIGRQLIQNQTAMNLVPVSPLDVLDAEVQGEIGYLLEQTLKNLLIENKLHIPVIGVLTQVLVSRKDKAFRNPSKPIGPFYSEREAEKFKRRGFKIVNDAGRGFRRVVASPKPIKIIEGEIIKKLIKEDVIVIGAGGGGIPVYRVKGKLKGVEAVIDKDFASACLAKSVNASTLLILTGVDKVYLNYKKKNQKGLRKLSVNDAKKYLKEGHFAKGSMMPKIKAAIDFLNNGGKKVIITSPSKVAKALKGLAGTLIVKR